MSNDNENRDVGTPEFTNYISCKTYVQVLHVCMYVCMSVFATVFKCLTMELLTSAEICTLAHTHTLHALLLMQVSLHTHIHIHAPYHGMHIEYMLTYMHMYMYMYYMAHMHAREKSFIK